MTRRVRKKLGQVLLVFLGFALVVVSGAMMRNLTDSVKILIYGAVAALALGRCVWDVYRYGSLLPGRIWMVSGILIGVTVYIMLLLGIHIYDPLNGVVLLAAVLFFWRGYRIRRRWLEGVVNGD